jgi:uncharacterized protein (DUF58 family)
MIKVNKIFIVISLVIPMFVVISGGYIPFLVFYGMIFMYIISLLYLKKIKSQLTVTIIIPEKVYYAGDTVSWKLVIESSIPVPYVSIIQYENGSILNKQKGHITLSENFWLHQNKTYYNRGNYDIGEVSIIIHDFFAIFSLHITEDFNKKIKVYPGLYNTIAFDAMGLDIFKDKININSQKENQYLISDIKKYIPGDSIKKIHWKVSAKLNDLHVKHFDSTAGENVIFIVDMNKHNFSYDELGINEENRIDALCSLVQYLVKRNIGLTIYLNGDTNLVYEINSFSQFIDFIDFIIGYKSNGENDFESYVTNIVKSCDTMSKICILAVQADPSISELLQTVYFQYQIYYYYCLEESNGTNVNLDKVFHYKEVINKNQRLFFGETV